MASETSVLHRILLSCGHGAVRLYRNNIGRWQDREGRWIVYGLCNPGGSDLIGWRSVVVTQDMVGKPIAQFVALEVKRARGGKLTPEQRGFLHNVAAAGGLSGVCTSEAEAAKVLQLTRTEV